MGYPSGNTTNFGNGISVNVDGAYGELTTDPVTGEYVVDVNTTGRPVYGQTPRQGAFLSSSIAGIPITVWVAGLFLIALIALFRRHA